MTKEQVIELIYEHESEIGESFTDRFMHDRVVWLNWLFWLVGKGHKEFAVKAINKIAEGESYLDQEELFDIYDVMGEWISLEHNNKLFEKNVDLWAEFLTDTPTYQERVEEFFKENELL